MIRLATEQSRIDQVPEGLSLYHLLRDHIESYRKLTGRTIDGLQAAGQLDDARGIKSHYHTDARDCGCEWCVKTWADANAEEAPLDRPAHLHSKLCPTPCDLIAGEPEPAFRWADEAEFGSKVPPAATEC